MGVRVLDWRLRGVLVRARLPFRFGIVELRELVHAFLFATVEVDGALEVGVAAERHLHRPLHAAAGVLHAPHGRHAALGEEGLDHPLA